MNNQNNNIIGYDPQTGQPVYANQNNNIMNQQFNNSQNNNINNNSNEEKLKKYRKMIHTDSIVLLVLSIIAIIFGLFVGGDHGYELFLRSLIYFIGFIIIIANKKEIKKFVGTFAIVIASIMILLSIFSLSLFDVAYLILGIFYIIHSIKYLKNFKGYEQPIVVQEKSKLDKLKYISLISLILSVVYPIISLFLSFFIESDFLYDAPVVISCLFALSSLILNIILLSKKRKSSLVYVCLVFSILITFFTGILSINTIKNELNKNNNFIEEDKEYVMYTLEDVENEVSQDIHMLITDNFIVQPIVDSNNSVLVNKEIYENAIKKYNGEYNFISSGYKLNTLKDYVCDGYTELYKYSSKNLCENNLSKNSLCKKYDNNYVNIKTFVKCTGNYNYQTDGFDQSKYENSKNNENYSKALVKDMEYNFNKGVIDLFRYKPELDNGQIIISLNKYETELKNTFSWEKSIFTLPKYNEYKCDGYVILDKNQTTSDIISNVYISCSGKYNYQTDGFDETKLQN